MLYDPPANVTTSVDMFTWINSTVSNWFFPAAILAVFFISLIKMLTNPGNTTGKSFAASSFICMIISVLARLLGFVNTGFMSIFIVFTALGAIWMHIENTR